MKRENPITDATGQVIQAAKPAIAVASGNIVGTKLTNLIANATLADQSNMVYQGGRVAIPFISGTLLFASSKNELVRSHAIGHVLTGVENILDWALPSLSGRRTTMSTGDSSDSEQQGQARAATAALPPRRSAPALMANDMTGGNQLGFEPEMVNENIL